MKDDAYGVAPIPIVQGGQNVASHVAGINIGVSAGAGNSGGALKLVEFLTSPEEQKILNAAFGTLPVVPRAYDDPRFRTEHIGTFRKVLAEAAETMPMIPQEAQFETLVGNTVKQLVADAAAGRPVGEHRAHRHRMKDSPHAEIARPRTRPAADVFSLLNRLAADGRYAPARDRASPTLYDGAARA
ncbi:extracellular solute-binding protein [Actinomadura sp. NPDC047616]|uniref:extracellular solute-binding protein n=1 Tax=Actinomadura sp. NPDC047616 TaxID=3155914 RepID=UPI0033C29CF6